jgi:hypothetical protein
VYPPGQIPVLGGQVNGVSALRIIAVALGLASGFFTFWTLRLLVVTGFLQHTRAGGQGAYVGAVVFPVLALAFAWASRRSWRRDG